MKKLLFLDVDGVLNNSESNFEFHPPSLLLLNNIVAATKCDIVLTSTWRMFHETRDELEVVFTEHKIPKWIDCTPQLHNQPRCEEIISWLLENVNDECVAAVLDDDEDARIPKKLDFVKTKFFRTNINRGLSGEEAQGIVDFLTVP